MPRKGDASRTYTVYHFTGFPEFAPHINVSVAGACDDEIVMTGIAGHLLLNANELHLIVGNAFGPGKTGNNEEHEGQGCQYLHDRGWLGLGAGRSGIQILDLTRINATPWT